MKTLKSALLVMVAGLALSACSYISPYKIEIQQGNVLTQEDVAQLRPGMTHAQVRYLLGTPLLTDIFHADRWDYVYTLSKKGQRMEERHITLFFDGDALKRVTGDVVPAPATAASGVAAQPAGAAVAASAPAVSVTAASAPAVQEVKQ